mmetsp:Transcript_53363/g.155261  ORF Transcript_53363/g.155261 Transcript_53363/m.155261 type:complete len:203 (+) Transcript_53363:1654-2262(+)
MAASINFPTVLTFVRMPSSTMALCQARAPWASPALAKAFSTVFQTNVRILISGHWLTASLNNASAPAESPWSAKASKRAKVEAWATSNRGRRDPDADGERLGTAEEGGGPGGGGGGAQSSAETPVSCRRMLSPSARFSATRGTLWNDIAKAARLGKPARRRPRQANITAAAAGWRGRAGPRRGPAAARAGAVDIVQTDGAAL